MIINRMSTSEIDTEECSEAFATMKEKWDASLEAIKNDVWKALEENANGENSLTERDKSGYDRILFIHRRGICLHNQFNVL